MAQQHSWVPIGEVLKELMAILKKKRAASTQPKITNSQTATIFSLAKQRGISQVDILALIKHIYDKPINELTLFEASAVIETLIEEVHIHA